MENLEASDKNVYMEKTDKLYYKLYVLGKV